MGFPGFITFHGVSREILLLGRPFTIFLLKSFSVKEWHGSHVQIKVLYLEAEPFVFVLNLPSTTS